MRAFTCRLQSHGRLVEFYRFMPKIPLQHIGGHCLGMRTIPAPHPAFHCGQQTLRFRLVYPICRQFDRSLRPGRVGILKTLERRCFLGRNNNRRSSQTNRLRNICACALTHGLDANPPWHVGGQGSRKPLSNQKPHTQPCKNQREKLSHRQYIPLNDFSLMVFV